MQYILNIYVPFFFSSSHNHTFHPFFLYQTTLKFFCLLNSLSIVQVVTGMWLAYKGLHH